MITLYVIFTLLGLTIFALSIFGIMEHDLDFGHHFEFGHHFDFGHHIDGHHGDSGESSGLFSIRTISAFIAGFGISGLLAKLVLNWGFGGQLLLGFGTGIFFGAIAFGIMKIMYDQQAGSVRDANTLIGKSALVTTATGSQKIGECRVENHYYTFTELNGETMQINELATVVKSEPGLLIIEKNKK